MNCSSGWEENKKFPMLEDIVKLTKYFEKKVRRGRKGRTKI